MSKFEKGQTVRVTGDTMEWKHGAAVGGVWVVRDVYGNATDSGYPTNDGIYVENEKGNAWDIADEDLELVTSVAIGSHAKALISVKAVLDFDLPDHVKTAVIKTLVEAL